MLCTASLGCADQVIITAVRGCEHLRVPGRWSVTVTATLTELCYVCYQRQDQRAAVNVYVSHFSIGQ